MSLAGKHAVVVGGTSGIGRGIAVRLAQENATVLIVGRNRDRANEVLAEMNAYGGRHQWIPCDATLIKNIRDCSSAIKSAVEGKPLDMLVLTQGIATVQGRTETSEGIDVKLALHYFGRMAFTRELLPLLREAQKPAHVLSVLSAGVHAPYAHYSTDFELKDHYSIKAAADSAGFYNDLAVDALSRDPANAGIQFHHAAPGFVNTNWGTEMPWGIRMLVRAIQPLGSSIQTCADNMLRNIIHPNVTNTQTGSFFLWNAKGRPTSKTKLHTDEAVSAVWGATEQVLDRVLQ